VVTTLWPFISMMRWPTLTPPRSAMPPRIRLQICSKRFSVQELHQLTDTSDSSPVWFGYDRCSKRPGAGSQPGSRRSRLFLKV
jgi:hypothetical protein